MVRRRTPRRSDPARSQRSLLEIVPAWIQALTALAGLVVTVLGIGYLTRSDGGDPPAAREVWIVQSSVGSEVSGSGEYRGLRIGEEEIVLLVAVEGEDRLIPVKAEREPDAAATSPGIEAGDWEAVALISANAATLQPIFVPAGIFGAGGDALEQLATEGADADFVIAAGEAVQASP